MTYMSGKLELIVPLHSTRSADHPPLPLPPVHQVGGKAASLIRLCNSTAASRSTSTSTSASHPSPSYRVPRGFVLTTNFFRPWIEATVRSDEWRRVTEILAGSGDGSGRENKSGGHPRSSARRLGLDERKALEEACAAAKEFASSLPLENGGEEIDSAISGVSTDGSGGMKFAVRSSSPEEDMAGASFAGLYETVLDVEPANVVEAVRKCFVSCLDSRVWIYKHKKNMIDNDDNNDGSMMPKIAVVVQQMCPAAAAGVAFSINPLTNDYDECYVNASWGVGEALVSGDITPDAAVVNSVDWSVLEYRLGDKGGDRVEEQCLTNDIVSDVAKAAKQIENELYDGDPVDIEFAIDPNDELWILQARPVTTYVPLHPSIQTKPGEFRQLYMDGYLTDGVTMSKPTTPMTNDIMVNQFCRLMFAWVLDMPPEDVNMEAGGYAGFERVYVNFSSYFHLMGKKALRDRFSTMDPTAVAILTSPEVEKYKPKKPPKQLTKFHVFKVIFPLLWKRRILYTVFFRPIFHPDKFYAKYDKLLTEWDEWIRRPLDLTQTLRDCLLESWTRLGKISLRTTYPAIMLLARTIYTMKGTARTDHQKELIDSILKGHEHDLIVRFGIKMYEMAKSLPPEYFNDLEALSERILKRDQDGGDALSGSFFAEWDDFLHLFGCRGPLEMEIASQRYGESPYTILLHQMASVATSDDEYSPLDVQKRQIIRHKEASEDILKTLSRCKRSKFKKQYKIYARCSLEGVREMPKHHMIQVIERARRLVLHRADRFMEQGRLDSRNDVFELFIDDVDNGYQDPSIDLRKLVHERGAFVRKLRRHVNHFPLFIDSRGRILRPTQEAKDGEFVGAPVSSGVARGPVKVLNDPFEKDIVQGDVLVAFTTDPGWTPLFITASAIVLQIGGELQHGALVAREYGKPCVSGIADVMTVLKDGMMVEVDGNAGVVRVVQ